jgi:eukaryotic-like serine/threonine-protein kinase
VILFAPTIHGPLYRVTSAGVEPIAVTKPTPQQFSHRFPSFLPDGRHFLYFATGDKTVFVGALDSNVAKRVLSADTNAAYPASGDLLFVRQGTLLRQSFDPKKLDLSGDPTPVSDRVASAASTYVAAFSVSENGVLAYRNGPVTSGNVQLAWFDRTGKPVETIGMPGGYRGVDVSPDGKRIWTVFNGNSKPPKRNTRSSVTRHTDRFAAFQSTRLSNLSEKPRKKWLCCAGE